MTHQRRQPALPFGELRLVSLALQLLRQVERGQHVELVDLRRQWRCHRKILIARVGQALLQRVEHDLANRQRAIAVVGSFDNDPRRPRRIGHAQDVAGGILQLVVGFQAIPARFGHPPRGQRVFLHRLEARALAILREVKPELEDQCAFIDQHRLETVDLVHALIKITFVQLAEDTVADRIRIPRTGKHTGPPFRWQGAPVAPHVRALDLLVARCRKGQRRQIARVHPFVEHVDRFALARAIDAADQDDDRELAVFAQFELSVEQGRAQLGNLLAERFLVDRVPELCRFKHDLLPFSLSFPLSFPLPP